MSWCGRERRKFRQLLLMAFRLSRQVSRAGRGCFAGGVVCCRPGPGGLPPSPGAGRPTSPLGFRRMCAQHPPDHPSANPSDRVTPLYYDEAVMRARGLAQDAAFYSRAGSPSKRTRSSLASPPPMLARGVHLQHHPGICWPRVRPDVGDLADDPTRGGSRTRCPTTRRGSGADPSAAVTSAGRDFFFFSPKTRLLFPDTGGGTQLYTRYTPPTYYTLVTTAPARCPARGRAEGGAPLFPRRLRPPTG